MPRIDWGNVEVRVKGSKGDFYVVTIVGQRPYLCTCPNFMHRAGPAGEFCKHMAARSGPESIGTTRCAQCRVYLTPEEIDNAENRQLFTTRPSTLCEGCFTRPDTTPCPTQSQAGTPPPADEYP